MKKIIEKNKNAGVLFWTKFWKQYIVKGDKK